MLDVEATGPEHIYATSVHNKQLILSTTLFEKAAVLDCNLWFEFR
jgi:hypothetical protein